MAAWVSSGTNIFLAKQQIKPQEHKMGPWHTDQKKQTDKATVLSLKLYFKITTCCGYFDFPKKYMEKLVLLRQNMEVHSLFIKHLNKAAVKV